MISSRPAIDEKRGGKERDREREREREKERRKHRDRETKNRGGNDVVATHITAATVPKSRAGHRHARPSTKREAEKRETGGGEIDRE